MRKALADALTAAATKDKRIVLLTADLGFGVWDVPNGFKATHPDRFFNVGCSEQNMIGIATGLAKAGMRPVCYSIATFAMLRPFEFVRNGPVAHDLPVTIVGVGAGTDYSFDGLTHYAIEDLALARTLPGLDIYTPASDEDVPRLLQRALGFKNPSYFRISRTGAPEPAPDIRLASPNNVDVLVLSHGAIWTRAQQIAGAIRNSGLSTKELSVKMFTRSTGHEMSVHLRRAKCIVVVEDHRTVGGLGSLVAEVIALHRLDVPLVLDTIDNRTLTGPVGTAKYMEFKSHRPLAHVAHDAVQRVHQ